MPSDRHAIFDRYPLQDEKVQTSAGPQPTPYHVYDGHALLVGGTADLAAVEALLEPEDVIPIQTETGRALMAIWATQDTEASHGTHGELQVSIYVSRRPLPPVPDKAFTILRLFLEEREARQMCHGLWNDSPAVVAYNKEILGLTPQLARYAYEREDGRLRFEFKDAESDALLARGDVGEGKHPSMAATKALFETFGLAGAMRAAATKVVEMKVVNPIGEAIPRNDDALAVSASNNIVADLFDPESDRIELLVEPYAGLGFEPTFVEHLQGFKLVYLTPEAAPGA